MNGRAMKSKNPRGFTLIELLIAVAIIGILAAIAYPSYQGQIAKSRRAEGKALLLEIAQALEKCKTLYGVYNSGSCATVGNITGGSTIPSTEGFYLASASAGPTATTFTLRSVPQQLDPLCGTLTLDQAGSQGESGTGTVDDCW